MFRYPLDQLSLLFMTNCHPSIIISNPYKEALPLIPTTSNQACVHPLYHHDDNIRTNLTSCPTSTPAPTPHCFAECYWFGWHKSVCTFTRPWESCPSSPAVTSQDSLSSLSTSCQPKPYSSPSGRFEPLELSRLVWCWRWQQWIAQRRQDTLQGRGRNQDSSSTKFRIHRV